MNQISFFAAILLSALATGLGGLCAQPLKIKGSDTMLPLLEGFSSLYAQEYGKAPILHGGGSRIGIDALEMGQADLAISSRGIRQDEKNGIPNLRETVVAYDALSIIVHRSNPISKLTIAQLGAVFRGEIKSWKELGGEDQPIRVYSRDQHSGTFAYVKAYLLGSRDFSMHALVKRSNAAIVEGVMSDPYGIGYIGFNYLDEEVKALSISKTGRSYYPPTFRNALERKYPLLRPLYFYHRSAEGQGLKEFIALCLSSKAQMLASSKGYIPVSIGGD